MALPYQHDVYKSLVERRSKVAKACDALAIAQRLRQCRAQRQGDVLVRVVVVDPGVALRVHDDVKEAMRRQLLRATGVVIDTVGDYCYCPDDARAETWFVGNS